MPDFGIFRGFNDKLFGNKLYAGQLPTQLGTIGSVSLYDADAQAFFDRVTTAGGTLSTLEKGAVNQLVLDMKSYSIWSKMKTIYPMVGASAAACKQNLKSSSFTGSFSTGWTFASTGVTPNGSSAYMDSNFSPFVSSIANSFHLSVYSRTNINVNAYDFAVNNSPGSAYNPEYSIRMQRLDLKMSSVMGDYNNQFIAETVANSLGFGIGTRTASNSMKLYKNGTALNSNTNTSSTTYPNFKIYLGATNFGGAASGYSSREYAFASIGDGLSDTEAGNFYTSVQAFQTTLSRQV